MTNLFYRYYDTLFKKKDYSAETELVFRLAGKFGVDPERILEIGCGTGNHTVFLAQKSKEVVAIDVDPKMVELCRAKIKRKSIKNVTALHTRVEDLEENGFDLALALFNVVTYIASTEELESFMQGVAKQLNLGGIFVFDCWNGVAALRDPPKTKTGTDYTLVPTTDFFNQVTRLTYRIGQDSYSFSQTLWTPMQIQSAIKAAGMETLLCSPLMKPDKPATYKDWKIMFCCRKPK